MILRTSARSRLRSRGEYAGIDSDEQKSIEHEGLTAWASTPYAVGAEPVNAFASLRWASAVADALLTEAQPPSVPVCDALLPRAQAGERFGTSE